LNPHRCETRRQGPRPDSRCRVPCVGGYHLSVLPPFLGKTIRTIVFGWPCPSSMGLPCSFRLLPFFSQALAKNSPANETRQTFIPASLLPCDSVSRYRPDRSLPQETLSAFRPRLATRRAVPTPEKSSSS